MVIFDANFLLLLLDPDAGVPQDPTTGQPLARAGDRVAHLIATLSRQRDTIGIPTPAIAEILVYAGSAGQNYLATLTTSSQFRILPFDLRAAIETAAMEAGARSNGDRKAGSREPWQKVKIDRQITAIAVLEQSSILYTDDQSVAKLAKGAGLQAVSSWELPLPPEDPQGSLEFLAPSSDTLDRAGLHRRRDRE